jgi:nitrate reductase beta subunit
LGVLLYDADKIEEYANAPESELVQRQRDMILDPHDPEVIEAAGKSGVHFSMIEAAQKSPVYKFVKEWGMALPLHPEFRTLPMLFYIPPLLPVVGYIEKGNYKIDDEEFFTTLDKARLPMRYLASLFSAGDESRIRSVLEKMLAVRMYRRAKEVDDITPEQVKVLLDKTGLTEKECEEIYRITALPTFEDRFVIPTSHREYQAELAMGDAYTFKAEIGIGGSLHVDGRPDRGM